MSGTWSVIKEELWCNNSWQNPIRCLCVNYPYIYIYYRIFISSPVQESIVTDWVERVISRFLLTPYMVLTLQDSIPPWQVFVRCDTVIGNILSYKTFRPRVVKFNTSPIFLSPVSCESQVGDTILLPRRVWGKGHGTRRKD